MSTQSDFSSLESFAVDMLSTSPFIPSELRALKYGIEIGLLPEVTTSRVIREIASRSNNAMSYEDRIDYLTRRFQGIIDKAVLAKSKL